MNLNRNVQDPRALNKICGVHDKAIEIQVAISEGATLARNWKTRAGQIMLAVAQIMPASARIIVAIQFIMPAISRIIDALRRILEIPCFAPPATEH